MRIGVVKEIKPAELRVALTPAGTEELVAAGHTVLVERSAGEGSGFPDNAYVHAGATIVDDVDKVWEDVDILVKVKEPVGAELARLREGLILFTYLHLAAAPELTGPCCGRARRRWATRRWRVPRATCPCWPP